MQQKKIKIANKLGLHARAAAKLVSLTSKYSSKVELLYKNKSVNGKSIMGLMMLAASEGSELEIIVEGSDEVELMTKIESLISNKFNEGA
jgi:phosphocarrier protein HPr